MGNNRTFLYGTVQRLSEDIYKKFARDSTEFCHNYFPYFKLVKCYANSHYHFLVVKRDYCYVWWNSFFSKAFVRIFIKPIKKKLMLRKYRLLPLRRRPFFLWLLLKLFEYQWRIYTSYRNAGERPRAYIYVCKTRNLETMRPTKTYILITRGVYIRPLWNLHRHQIKIGNISSGHQGKILKNSKF